MKTMSTGRFDYQAQGLHFVTKDFVHFLEKMCPHIAPRLARHLARVFFVWPYNGSYNDHPEA